MQNKGSGGNSQKRGPQNTRVYAPTHRSGASPASGTGQGSKLRQAKRPERNERPARQSLNRDAADKPARISATPERYAPSRMQKVAPKSVPHPTSSLRRQEEDAPRRGAHERRETGKKESKTLPLRPTEKRRKKDGQAGTITSIHRLESISAAEEARERELAREEKKQKKKQKEPADPKKLIAYGIVGVSIIALLLLGYFMFLLQAVEVVGNETYSDESIIELSGLRIGTHMLLCSDAQVKSNIEENPYLQVKAVEKELPDTIRIKIAERREVAAIRSQEYDVIIDSTGHVLSIGKGSDLSNLLLVSGMSTIGFEVNEQIGTATDLQTQALLSLIRELEALDLLKDVARADLSNPLNVCLYTTDNITVALGQTDGLSDKLAWMRDTLPSLRKSGVCGGTLDVSAKGGAIYSPAPATPSSLEEPEENPEDPEQTPEQPEGSPDQQA